MIGFDPSLGLIRRGGLPLFAPAAARATPAISQERIFRGGLPVGGRGSLFFGGGAPIARLGLVFFGGLPIGGPVGQIFRGGGAPVPPTLFAGTLSPSGPIGTFLIGLSGGPIGVQIFGGGGLPIGPSPAERRAIAELQARTALVTAPAIGLPGPFGG